MKKSVSEADAALAEKWAAQIIERIVSHALALVERQKVSIRDGADATLSTPGIEHLNAELARISGKALSVEALARLVAERLDAPKQPAAPAEKSTAETLALVREADEMLDKELQPVADLFVSGCGMSKSAAMAAALKSLPGSYAAHCSALVRLSDGESLSALRRESMARAERVRALAAAVKSQAKAGGYAKALRATLAA